ncbi:M48 family metallopeptidase [Novosphingobium sp. BL-8A]|uniref:M48 family metallopeptidase n=1 Tax=Novosphingobium sp. BL-8A TaxID=3127639 RepID=UPI003757EC9D
MRRTVCILLASTIAFGDPALSLASDPPPPLEDIRAVDAEMAEIGYRLAVANASLCDRQEPGLGILVHTPTQYGLNVRDIALRHFHLDGPAGVEAVIDGSPAAGAGVKPDDTLLGAGPIRFAPSDLHAEGSTEAVIKIAGQIAHLPADKPLQLYGRRDGVDYAYTVDPVPACRTRFEVVAGPEFIAKADGEMVQIGSRFFADYPDLVAAPIAHELAHNILHHRDRLEAKGAAYGMMSEFGRNIGYFRQTELEADILSVSLLANAGYDPQIAVRFWRLFGPDHSGGMLRSRTHPAWKDRLATIEHAIKSLGPERPVHPAILAERDKPLDGDWQRLQVAGR